MTWTEPFDMSDPEQVAEARAYEASKLAQQRSCYSWTDAANDLALSSPMTLAEAGDVCREIKKSGVHAFDAFPILKVIYGAQTTRNEFARALTKLIQLAEKTD